MAPLARAATRKRRILRLMIAVCFLYGLIATFGESLANAAALTTIILISVLGFAWYCEDARERAFQRGRLMDFGVAAVALVGMPYYLLRSRGVRGGASTFAIMVLFYFGLMLLMLLGGVVGLVLRAAVGLPVPF